MADLGPVAIRLFPDVKRNTAPRQTMRNTAGAKPAWYSPDWQGDRIRTFRQSMTTYRTRSTTPAWWGSLPTGEATILPAYEIRGRVMQRDAVTGEDFPAPLIRVSLFYRRTNYVIDTQVSDEDGYVVFQNLMPGNQAYYGIAFDAEGSPLQNSVIWDRLSSVPGT